MISSAKPAATSTSSTPATAAAPASPAVAAPFDALFETLAATIAPQAPADGTGLDACLEGNSLGEGEDGKVDDGDGIDAENPLAFLASLLSAAMVASQAQAITGDGSAADDGVGDALSGQAKHSATTDAALLPLTTVLPADPNAVAGSDALLADKVLQAADKAVAAFGKDVAGVDAAAPQDPTSGSTRAAEWFTHAPRHIGNDAHDTIATPVRDPRWAEDFSARVALMVRGGESSASMQLSPPDLGPVDVSVTMRDTQATIHFGAAQAETRALLEASIPQLREMLAAQGFNLMDASVSQGFARQSRPDAPAQFHREAEPEAEVRATRISATGLLDLYA